MANILGIVDPILERRNKYVDAVRHRLKIFPWLQCDEMHYENATLVWAAIPSAPVNKIRIRDRIAGLILGNLDSEYGAQSSISDYAMKMVKERGVESLAGHGGFYMTCMCESADSVMLGTDLLGLFPLYYYSTDQFLLFSTMYSLFRYFPQFSPDLNPRGLAGILLTMHISGDQTLYKNVRRLPVGHILRWHEGKGSSEVPIDKLKPTSVYFGKPYQENLETFNQLLHKTVSKSAANNNTLLLSGGLDSRLLAGYLSKLSVSEPAAVSLGDASDNEVKFAARAAKRIGWPHLRIGVDYARFPEFARRLVEIEQVSNGFADLAFFQASERFYEVASTLVTGFAGDIVMGGSHVRAGYDKMRQMHSFDAKFKIINRYGFSPDRIKQLIRPDVLGNGVEEAMEELRQVYNSIEGLPFQRTWMFDMIHRVRFHTAASIVWRLSFGSWPIMPYIDREILEAAFGMPEETLEGRRVQIDLLCQRFSSLAHLPVERLSLDTSPLLMPFYRRYLASLMRRTDFHRRKYGVMRRLKMPNYESRFYYKTFDINNEGWSAVRRDAEQYRVKAEKIFSPEMLRELLPPPNIPIHVPAATVDSSSRKLLLALTLWAGDNL
jgi:asparagine synthase (glutamine-hydrolysing)